MPKASVVNFLTPVNSVAFYCFFFARTNSYGCLQVAAIAANPAPQCPQPDSRWPSRRSNRHFRRSLSWLARHMEQSRLRLLAEFDSMRFAERASCEVMPTGYPGCQPRTPQPAAPSRPHRLASLWGGLSSRTQSPFAHAAQQARPFDSDTPIYSSKASLVAMPKAQMPPAQVSQLPKPTVLSEHIPLMSLAYE